MKIYQELPLLDRILDERSSIMGNQFLPYRNHVYRVVNFCFAFHQCDPTEIEKIIIAGCFHDLGIWPTDTVYYIDPSIELAKKYLDEQNNSDWADEIGMMIDLHHKFRQVRNCQYPLVEIFRKGDWVDASLGLRTFGLPRADVRQVQASFPNLGFHNNLLRLAFKQFLKNPLNPLPMMKW
jgi:hypothetical protein